MERILVLDDEPISLSLVSKILQNGGYSVTGSDDPVAAMADFGPGSCDLLLTDFFMPGMSGQEVVERARTVVPELPIIVLTASKDVEITVQLFKHGVADYIVKPILPDDLLHRVGAAIEEARLRAEVRRIAEEKRLVELESEKLVNWRMLYAYKDIAQTEQLINLLTRTINSSGGYSWLDLLSELPRKPNGSLELEPETLDLVVSSASSHRSIIDFLSFVSRIPKMELDIKAVPAASLASFVAEYARHELAEICARHERLLSVSPLRGPIEGEVAAEAAQLERVCRELVVNAIKYSPPGSRISVEISRGKAESIVLGKSVEGWRGDEALLVAVRNTPRALQARGSDGNPIVGIPYAYSELVFDLFFTIESFPTRDPDEEWSDGTGLYVARKLLARMGAMIAAASGIDYSGERPQPTVQLTMAFPLKR